MSYLGIDTSNYKTSIAAIDEDKRVLCNISEYLEVPPGQRGLRQSEAFFKHSNKLPELFSVLLENLNPDGIEAIGVSDKPRRVEDSYMPCFLAGVNLAKILSEVFHVPLHFFSHQEGHAAAVIEAPSAADIPENAILMHLSGGTTEILKCSMDNFGYKMDIIGGTFDISLGQLLDRFGVALGFPFPSGMHLDELSSMHDKKTMPGIVPGIAVLDGYFNLSGPETVLMKYARDYGEKSSEDIVSDIAGVRVSAELAAVSYELFDRIGDILTISSDMLTAEYNIDTVYMAGGVASSSSLKRIISEKTEGKDYRIIFGDPSLSGDNAVGTALLTRRMYVHKL